MTTDDPGIKSTATCFEILEAIESNGSAGISELARAVDISKSGVYKHVHTLSRLGYLVRRGDEYHLSLRFLGFGGEARNHLPVEVVETAVTQLSETTGHSTNFVARENDRGVYAILAKRDGIPSVELSAGDVAPIHATAGGKAIFAWFDEGERDEIVDERGLPRYTEKTLTDRSALDEELQSVRDRGVAFDREEFIQGSQSVASPVLTSEREPIGAVSVTGDSQQLSGKRLEEDVVGLVISAAKTIEKAVRTA